MISLPERLKVGNEHVKKSFDNYDFDLRCASPGIIVSFDANTQTAEIQLTVTERIKIDGVESVEKVPILPDVPIIIPQIKGYSLTFPIEPGDECLVIFSDTCFDAWFQSGGIQNQMSLRRHDLSDGFAIVGIKSQPNVIPNYSTSSVQLRNNAGANFFELSASLARMVFGNSEVKATASTVDITSATVNITGNTQINLISANQININAEGNTYIDEKRFLEHQHDGVEDGPDTTGGVV